MSIVNHSYSALECVLITDQTTNGTGLKLFRSIPELDFKCSYTLLSSYSVIINTNRS